MYKEPDKGLFYRKSSGLKEFYEHCELPDIQANLFIRQAELLPK